MRKGPATNRSCLRKEINVMIKKYYMENVDCANCAARMEEGIKKLEGVNDARVNFLTQN